MGGGVSAETWKQQRYLIPWPILICICAGRGIILPTWISDQEWAKARI